MSIQTKFLVLLTVLVTVVGISIGAAAWAVSVIYVEASRGYTSRSLTLKGLINIEKSLQPQRRVLEEAHGPFPAPRPVVPNGPDRPKSIPWVAIEPGSLLVSYSNNIDHGLRELETLPTFRREVGYSTSANLRTRVDRYRRHVVQWRADPSEEGVRELRTELRDIEELIEHINHRILDGATADIENLGELRARVGVVLTFAVVAAVLAGVLGVLLVRRWVSRPVAMLRAATATFAEGDFSHRVQVQGSDEIALLGRDVNHMAATVTRLQEERIETERLAAVGEVVRRIAHNLRNPLAGIRSLAELSRAETSAGTDLHEQQDRIVKTIDRCEGWLEELLRVMRPLDVDASSLDATAWLPPVAETLRPRAEARGVQLDVMVPTTPLNAAFDPGHLEQAVVAALSNAIEASPTGGTVRVSLELESGDRQSGHWSIRVADQGPGIPVHLHEQVFKPYFTTKPDGNGIGLAVVQQVVRAHGGRVLLGPGLGAVGGSQSPNKGVTVSLTLPLVYPGSSITVSG